MPSSPLQTSNGVIDIAVLCDGKELPTGTEIVSIEIVCGLNRIPLAKLTLLDGNMPESTFPLSDGVSFKPGSEVEIKAGYDTKLKSLFKGIVVKHGISIHSDGTAELQVECKDKAVALTVGRHNANYLDMDDGAIIQKIAGKYGLSVQTECSAGTHKELLQYYSSDWDFIMTRAEANGCWLRMDQGKLNVEKAEAKGSAVLTLTYGADILEFRAIADSQQQIKKVETVSWDPAQQKITTGNASSQALTSFGNLEPADLAKVLAIPTQSLQTAAPQTNEALTAWATAQQIKNELNRIRGSVTCQGTELATVACQVELKGVGERFNGTMLATSVRHELRAGSWNTEIGFGMDGQWFCEKQNTESPLASGLNSGVAGLQVGIVLKLDGDPENQSRIQVSVPVMRSETEGVWARFGSPYASEQFGMLFWPEVGDEVILGYFNSDPSHPVILGSLYSTKHKPALALAAENNTKSIVTRSKITIEFNEEKKILTLKTPGNNQVVLSDEGKSISLQDQNGNSVILSDKGIALDSGKDISIKAKGKVIIDAMGNLECASKADAKIEGMNVNLNAKVGLTAKGSASAEFSASGQTVVKGAMVMIN